MIEEEEKGKKLQQRGEMGGPRCLRDGYHKCALVARLCYLNSPWPRLIGTRKSGGSVAETCQFVDLPRNGYRGRGEEKKFFWGARPLKKSFFFVVFFKFCSQSLVSFSMNVLPIDE